MRGFVFIDLLIAYSFIRYVCRPNLIDNFIVDVHLISDVKYFFYPSATLNYKTELVNSIQMQRKCCNMAKVTYTYQMQ